LLNPTSLLADALGRNLAETYRQERHLDRADEAIVRELVERHLRFTGSTLALAMIDDWDNARGKFVKVFPHEYRRALGELAAKHRRLAA